MVPLRPLEESALLRRLPRRNRLRASEVHDYGKEIEIAVSDTGVGIPEKDLPNLFQKFNKVQKPGMQISGTGFGLVTAKQIIDLHKGFIKARSQVNKGTTFIIRLPK